MTESRKETSAPALSPAHSAALVARMLTLEQDCREIEHFLDGYAGIFYQYLGLFPDETRRTIRTLISEILQRITRIRLDLGVARTCSVGPRFFGIHRGRTADLQNRSALGGVCILILFLTVLITVYILISAASARWLR
jgi:hypothetical protein